MNCVKLALASLEAGYTARYGRSTIEMCCCKKEEEKKDVYQVTENLNYLVSLTRCEM